MPAPVSTAADVHAQLSPPPPPADASASRCVTGGRFTAPASYGAPSARHATRRAPGSPRNDVGPRSRSHGRCPGEAAASMTRCGLPPRRQAERSGSRSTAARPAAQAEPRPSRPAAAPAQASSEAANGSAEAENEAAEQANGGQRRARIAGAKRAARRRRPPSQRGQRRISRACRRRWPRASPSSPACPGRRQRTSRTTMSLDNEAAAAGKKSRG